MEVSLRTIRCFNRILSKPFRCTLYRNASGGGKLATNDDVNTELVNTFNNDIKAGGVVPVFRRALLFPHRIALHDDVGTYTYGGLHHAAAVLSKEIAAMVGGEEGRPVAYMCNNDASHVIVQWAIWMTGNIAVPLTQLHPPEMLKYFVEDSGAALIVCSPEFDRLLRPVASDLETPLLVTSRGKQVSAQLHHEDDLRSDVTDVGRTNAWYGDSEAMLIYTSGTTSKPKGVVVTHGMLAAQVAALHAAWRYSAHDVVLHALPLHHIHGQLNSVNASLAAGSRIRMLPQFVAHSVWARLLALGEREEARPTVFHGVPAMYARLVAEHAVLFKDARSAEHVKRSLSSRMRLMCAGSAPLPATLANQWEEITGIRLLERYGMSEVGMALSNPYRPVSERRVGAVGAALPGVSARIARPGDLQPLLTASSPPPDMLISLEALGLSSRAAPAPEWSAEVTEHEPAPEGGHSGELLLQGPSVFTRYWNRAPKLDNSDFTPDGWFRTGDTASYTEGIFRILGRTSVDIIKTGGYKVSALQVESAALEHPNVADAAVLGIPHETMGEIVGIVVQPKDGATITLKELKEVAAKSLPPYSLPRKLLVVEVMPRNAMGKLDKKEIRRLYGDKLRSPKKE